MKTTVIHIKMNSSHPCNNPAMWSVILSWQGRNKRVPEAYWLVIRASEWGLVQRLSQRIRSNRKKKNQPLAGSRVQAHTEANHINVKNGLWLGPMRTFDLQADLTLSYPYQKEENEGGGGGRRWTKRRRKREGRKKEEGGGVSKWRRTLTFTCTRAHMYTTH